MKGLNLALAISGRNIRSKNPMIICGVYSYNNLDILNTTSISENTPDNAYSNLNNKFYRFIEIQTKDIPEEIKKNKKLEIYTPGIEMIAFSQLIEPFKGNLNNIQIHVRDESHQYVRNIEDLLNEHINAKIELITKNNTYSHLMMFARNQAHNLYVTSIKKNKMPNNYSILPNLRTNIDLFSFESNKGNPHLR